MRTRLLTTLTVVVVLAAAGCRRDCASPTSPCGRATDLTGAWSGLSTYINAPFTMELRQTGTTVSGQYRDQKDAGSVSGTASGSSFLLDVTFGDTGIRFTGTVESRDRLTGEVLVPALGGRRFPFEMVR